MKGTSFESVHADRSAKTLRGGFMSSRIYLQFMSPADSDHSDESYDHNDSHHDSAKECISARHNYTASGHSGYNDS